MMPSFKQALPLAACAMLVCACLPFVDTSRPKGAPSDNGRTIMTIEILRDKWGIAHVYAGSEAAGFFGVGYAMAQDRMLQLMLKRREAQGRLAEILGAGQKDIFLQSDTEVRTLNLGGIAEKQVALLGAEERPFFEAFAGGVNAWLRDNEGKLPPLFEKYGGRPEPWRVADTLAIWNKLGTGFGAAWKGEVPAKRAFEKDPDAFLKTELTSNQAPQVDDRAAVVSEEEFKRSNPRAYEELKSLPRSPIAFDVPPPPQPIKASHNWAVSGARSTTGKPILEGDPQLVVNNPNVVYEFHLCAGRFNARGMGWPGIPTLLVGFNERISWAATALNTDSADLFEERVNPDNPRQYRFKEEWREFTTRKETIRVKGRDSIELEIRETIHGPVVNHLLPDALPGEVFALRCTFLVADRHSADAHVKLMAARDWASFRAALEHFYTPGTHLIYADVDGNIGYQAVARIPKRAYRRTLPRQGWTGKDEWEWLPFDYMPNMLNPKTNYVATANDLPVGAWHPYATSNGLGGGPRSKRLGELFAGDRKFSVEDFLKVVHQDAVTPPLRDFVRIATVLHEQEGVGDPDAAKAIEALRRWNGQTRTDAPEYDLAESVLDELSSAAGGEVWHMDRDLGYSSGWTQMSAKLRDEAEAMDRTGKPLAGDPSAKKMFAAVLAAGWKRAQKKPRTPAEGAVYKMPYQNNAFYGSIHPEYDLDSPPLVVPHSHTIFSQKGQCYVQIADMGDLDRSLALHPPGISENPDSPHYKDQMDIWREGGLRPAPLSRKAVEKYRESSMTVEYRE